MADDAPSLGIQTKQLARVRDVVADVLASVPEVDAAFVKVEGSYVSVRVSVARVDEGLMMRLVEASYALEARAPGLSFGILPFEHDGRDAQGMAWLGVGPLYVRDRLAPFRSAQAGRAPASQALVAPCRSAWAGRRPRRGRWRRGGGARALELPLLGRRGSSRVAGGRPAALGGRRGLGGVKGVVGRVRAGARRRRRAPRARGRGRRTWGRA